LTTKKRTRKIKVTLEERLHIMDLFAEGKSKEEILTEFLAPKHPQFSLDIIEADYFPPHGAYSIQRMESRTREEIEKAKDKLKIFYAENTEMSRKHLAELRKDPGFRAAQKERLKKHWAKLHADPDFAAALKERARQRLKEMNGDPELVKKRSKRCGEVFKKLHKDTRWVAWNREQASNLLKRLHADPVFAAARDKRASERMTKLHKNPDFARRRDLRASRPESIKKLREGLNLWWQNEENKEKMREKLLNQRADTDFIQKMHEGLERFWNTPGNREQAQKIARGILLKQRENPDFIKKMLEGQNRFWNTPGNRERGRERFNAFRNDPAFKEKMLAGIGRYWHHYREQMKEYLKACGIEIADKSNGKKGKWVGSIITPEHELILKEEKQIIDDALNSLWYLERGVIKRLFFNGVNIRQAALEMRISEDYANDLYDHAILKLLRNEDLKELYEGS
jgi:hypothetical protein